MTATTVRSTWCFFFSRLQFVRDENTDEKYDRREKRRGSRDAENVLICARARSDDLRAIKFGGLTTRFLLYLTCRAYTYTREKNRIFFYRH